MSDPAATYVRTFSASERFDRGDDSIIAETERIARETGLTIREGSARIVQQGQIAKVEVEAISESDVTLRD